MTVSRVLDLDSIRLAAGTHAPGDKFSVMEAVAYIGGEGWSDRPKCASPVIGPFLRTWNDAMSDGDRQMLKQFIPRLVGTAASDDVELKRSWKAVDWHSRTVAPLLLRAAGLEAAAVAIENTSAIFGSLSAAAAQAALNDARRQAGAAWIAARVVAGETGGSDQWRVAGNAAREVAGSTGWEASREAAGLAAREVAGYDAGIAALNTAWETAWVIAWRAGNATRRLHFRVDDVQAALRPVVIQLQRSALALVDRMIECGLEERR